MSAVLSVRRLCVRYGGVQALTDVDIDVATRTMTALIGPNGAGKTTLIDAVTGLTPCQGTIHLQGRDVSGLRAHRRARLGMARTFQASELFADLNVRQNLNVAALRPGRKDTIGSVLRGRTEVAAGVEWAMSLLGIESLADCHPEELTQGQQKLVDVARGIAARPAVILLDEPAAGLDADESRRLGEHLRRVVDGGISVLLIDHDMDLVLKVSDEVVVLDFGQVISRGDPATVARDRRVIEAYLGEAEAHPAEAPA